MQIGLREGLHAGELRMPETPWKDLAELPDDFGEISYLAELPDDSGEKIPEGLRRRDGIEDDNLEKQMEPSVDISLHCPENCDKEELEEVLQEYIKDLKEYSECPETIPDKPFDTGDLKKRTPEENAEARKEFSDKKEQLKREWEEANGRPWPKYKHDVYSANGKLIRKAGSDYDAHHIQPLSIGGKNEASNLTPLNAEVHYDKQGIHAPDSPCSKLS